MVFVGVGFLRHRDLGEDEGQLAVPAVHPVDLYRLETMVLQVFEDFLAGDGTNYNPQGFFLPAG